MNHKKYFGKKEKGMALFEIFILIVSIGAFSYFIGNDFKFVGASDNKPSLSDASLAITTSKTILTPPVATVPTSFGTPSIESLSPVYAPPASGVGSTGELALPEPPAGAVPLSWDTFVKNIQGQFTNLLINAAIAAGLYYGTKWLGGLLCPTCSEKMLDSLGQSLALGYGIGSAVGSLVTAIWGPGASLTILGPLSGFGLIGIGVAVIIFLIFFRDEYIEAVVFTCYPWQPPTGGADCDKCNKGSLPCTKYKCESLGQQCKLENPGTTEELCTWTNKNDISAPIISSWDGPLDKEKFQYTPDSARLPPDKGVIIKYKGSSDGCIPPFTRIDYGITLNEPGKCKIDVSRKDSFDAMMLEINNGYYLYNHTITSIHAGGNESATEGINLPNGGKYEIFIRCQDGNGNSNVGTFVFKYCIQDEPDTTPPVISLTDPINGMPVQQGQTSVKTNVYTDKPSDCRWSHTDEDYDTMAGKMSCAKSITEMNSNLLYKCNTTLTGLSDSKENKFYFRCKSYPSNKEADRYKNEESYVYKLIGTNALVIDSLTPESGTIIKDATESVKITLQAKTSSGYNNGEAKCYFRQTSETDKSYILFANTDSYQNSQELWLTRGSYSYSIKCCDLGGNCDTQKTDFSVDTDFEAPIVVRAYNEGGELKIVTNEESECVYDTTSCSYNFDDGIKMTTSNDIDHTTTWDTSSNLYIKCKDKFGNSPAPDGCSITVRPFSIY